MTTFTMQLNSASQHQRIDDVVSFVGEDASGQFGLLANHSRVTTVLSYGLARYRGSDLAWRYLAVPEAVLYFADNLLTITARRYFESGDFEQISRALEDELRLEEQRLRTLKDNLGKLEREMFRKLWELSRQ